MKYLVNLDLSKNQLLNTAIQNLGALPETGLTAGWIVYYTGTGEDGAGLYICDGSTWSRVGAPTDSLDQIGDVTITDITSGEILKWNGTAWVNNTLAEAGILEIGGQAGSVANALTFTGGNTGTFNGSAALTVAVPYAWAQASTKPSYTAAEVGLGNVTNNEQIKASASSIDGNIPVWSGTDGDALGAGYSVETTLVGGATSIARADAVKGYIDGLLSASDAMVFKGTLGTGGTITSLPTSYSAGWAYKVITAGTYAGIVCQIGDLIIAIVDRSGSGNLNSDWTVVQTNIDGAVTGPVSATSANFASFNGTTGKIIADSGYGASSFAAPGDIKNGTLALQIGTAASTNNTITVGTGTGFSANTASNITYDIKVGPALTNLATLMTGASTGVLRKTAADTYSLDSTLVRKYATTLATSATSYVITHNLGSQDATVTVREVAADYAQVYCDVEFTSINTITLRFAVAPTAGAYRVVVTG